MTSPQSSASGRYVLVVDDDADIKESISLALTAAGYRTATASNGVEALACLRGSPPPCVILLDLMMPVMNGWDFRAEQERDHALSAIPVVVMTGFREMAKKAKSLRVASVLEKPLDLGRLLSTIAPYC